jgi:hypothetical protein
MEMGNEMEMEGKRIWRGREMWMCKKDGEGCGFFYHFPNGFLLFRTVEWKWHFYLMENNFTHSSLLICV